MTSHETHATAETDINVYRSLPRSPASGKGWQQPPSQLPAYGPPQSYSVQGVVKTDTSAIIALILSISSFLAFPVIPAIAALVLSANARRNISASGGAVSGEGVVKASIIISWVNLALAALAVVVVLIVVAFFGSAVSSQ